MSSSWALSRLSSCIFQANIVIKNCIDERVAQKYRKESKHLAYVHCLKQTSGNLVNCIKWTIGNPRVTSDCSAIFAPFSKTSLVVDANPKVVQCFDELMKARNQCRFEVSELKREQKLKKFRDCMAGPKKKTANCARQNIKSVYQLPPFEREITRFEMPWQYPQPLLPGTKGMVCLVTGPALGWYFATLVKSKGERVKLKSPTIVRGGYWFHQSQFAPLAGVELTHPNQEEKNIRAIKKRISMTIAAHYPLLRDMQTLLKHNRYNVKNMTDLVNRHSLNKNEFLDNLSLTGAGLVFDFDSELVGGRFSLTLMPQVTDGIKPTGWSCQLDGEVNLAFLPEVCQRGVLQQYKNIDSEMRL